MLRGYLFLLVPLLIGYLLKRSGFVPSASAAVLNFYVINIALPATVLISIRNVRMSYDLLIPALAQWGSLLTAAVIVIAVSRYFRFDRITRGTLLLVVPLGNTAFLGLSVIPVFFSREAIPYGVMYDQLGSFLALATYGAIIANAYGEGNDTDFKRLLIRVVTFPPLIFLILGFLLRDYSMPPVLYDVFTVLSWTLVPAAMLAIGLNLSLRIEKELIRPLASGLFVRLILMPAVILILFYLLGLNGLAVRVSIFQAAMPSMITAAVLASDRGLDKKLSTSIVSTGIILSLVTLPIVYLAIEYLLIQS